MYMFLCVCHLHKRTLGPLELESQAVVNYMYRCWEPNSGTLEEQPSLQLPSSCLLIEPWNTVLNECGLSSRGASVIEALSPGR